MKLSLPPKPILLPSPVMVVGSYSFNGRPNIMTVAWGGIVSSKPPCVSISIREATLTYHNIKQVRAFTVNIPSESYVFEADFAGMVSGRDADKFSEARLTAEKSERVFAPIVAEFPYALECRVVREIEIGSHTMFIGEIIGIVADDTVLNQKQLLPDIEKVRPVMWGSFGNAGYYGIGEKLGNAFSAGNDLKRGRK